MNSTEIEWEKYNILQQAIFWCFLNYRTSGAILFFIVTIIMLINCRAALKLYDAEQQEKEAKRGKKIKELPKVRHIKHD